MCLPKNVLAALVISHCLLNMQQYEIDSKASRVPQNVGRLGDLVRSSCDVHVDEACAFGASYRGCKSMARTLQCAIECLVKVTG